MQIRKYLPALCAAAVLAGSTAWASGRIMTLKSVSAELDLFTWMIVDHTYQLQCTSNLTSGVWIDLGDEFTAAATTTNLLVGTEAPSCWFRVVETEKALDGPTSPPEPHPLFIPALPPELQLDN